MVNLLALLDNNALVQCVNGQNCLRVGNLLTVNKDVAGIADGAKQAVGLISACATAGLIIGVLNMTGTGLKFAGAVIAFSGGSIPVALFLTMCASLVLGMGLPTAAAYLI